MSPALDSIDPYVLARCKYFTEVQIWPLKHYLNPQDWLDNFTPEELPMRYFQMLWMGRVS